MGLGSCYSCHKEQCVGCREAMYELQKDGMIDDQFIESLWREIENIAFDETPDGELQLAQNWRGWMAGELTQDDWFDWVDTHHSKGVGWVYENI